MGEKRLNFDELTHLATKEAKKNYSKLSYTNVSFDEFHSECMILLWQAIEESKSRGNDTLQGFQTFYANKVRWYCNNNYEAYENTSEYIGNGKALAGIIDDDFENSESEYNSRWYSPTAHILSTNIKSRLHFQMKHVKQHDFQFIAICTNEAARKRLARELTGKPYKRVVTNNQHYFLLNSVPQLNNNKDVFYFFLKLLTQNDFNDIYNNVFFIDDPESENQLDAITYMATWETIAETRIPKPFARKYNNLLIFDDASPQSNLEQVIQAFDVDTRTVRYNSKIYMLVSRPYFLKYVDDFEYELYTLSFFKPS